MDKTPQQPNFIKIGLQIFVVSTLVLGIGSNLIYGSNKPKSSSSSTLEPVVPPHVQAMHDNMSCDALRQLQKWREWDSRGCNK